MDPRLLQYYNQELRHIREMGEEFAEAYPKIAGRLALDGIDCHDPYVERLLEGFAFLAARVQLKLDAEFPSFTEQLLRIVYPHYLAPTPSMAVVEFVPDPGQGIPPEGFKIPRGSALRSPVVTGAQSPCEYRTASDVTLWPLELAEASYLAHAGDLSRHGLPALPDVKSALRLVFRSTGGVPLSAIGLETLRLQLRGADEICGRLYELLVGGARALACGGARGRVVGEGSVLSRCGFRDDEALLPFGDRSFRGYRLLHEYFAFPERFRAFELHAVGELLRRAEGESVELFVLLTRSDPELAGGVGAESFALHATPAVNLFPMRADRIHVSDREPELHVVPDRTRPLDFEVWSIEKVVGHGGGTRDEREFRPLYAVDDSTRSDEVGAFYTERRAPRVNPGGSGGRGDTVGTEIFLTLVDSGTAPYDEELKQLSLELMCTNRDLPLRLATGRSQGDFNLTSGAPVSAVRCIEGPTKPRPPIARGETAWRLISHLSLNYLSLVDDECGRGAGALRELLALYADLGDAATVKQIEGLHGVSSKPIVSRLPGSGPISFGRGLEIELTFDESGFEGSGVFLLGAVLEDFFARYVSINSFTKTVIRSTHRGEVMRWPARAGRTPLS